MTKIQASGLEFSSTTNSKGQLVFNIAGRLDLAGMESVISEFRRLVLEKRPNVMELDCRDLKYLDSAGALALLTIEKEAQNSSIDFSISNLSKKAQGIKALIDLELVDRPALKPQSGKKGFVEGIGDSTIEILDEVKSSISFFGEFLFAIGHLIKHPSKLRLGDVGFYMEQVGVNGLPIIGLIGFLMGLIMAFMSSLQLKDFGANIYVASLVAVAMVRELGPIMTAILVAGRSGSSFAAEIGTMKVNEEVDALTVMGFDPNLFLAMPKVIASVIMVPLLTIYSDLMAILGGLLVGIFGLDLTAYAYLDQTIKSIEPFYIGAGVVKSAVFALIISGVGCLQGFKVRGGAQSVGTATTKAVVSAMFLIIVADSAFAIILNYVE